MQETNRQSYSHPLQERPTPRGPTEADLILSIMRAYSLARGPNQAEIMGILDMALQLPGSAFTVRDHLASQLALGVATTAKA